MAAKGIAFRAKVEQVYRVRGEYLTRQEIAAKYGIRPDTVYRRAAKGLHGDALIAPGQEPRNPEGGRRKAKGEG